MFKKRYSTVFSLVVCLLLLILIPWLSSQNVRPASAADAPYLFSTKLSGGPVVYSSPTLADIDHPANGTKEILFGGGDGMLYVYNPDGTLKWSVNTGTPINSAPSVGDLDGNGDVEVVVSLGEAVVSQQTWDGGVKAYHHDGSPYWIFRTQDSVPLDGRPDGVWATPALGDLDGDGKMEVAFGAWDRNIYLLNYDGTQRWMLHNADTIWSSAALADLDGDGDLEIITGADYHPGGYIYIFDKDGTVLVRNFIGQTIMSSPAIGDINGDGELEIVAGTGFYDFSSDPGYFVNAWDRNGNYLPNWPRPTGGRVPSSPALADLDGDGVLEVVIACEDHKLYAWNGDGSPVLGWPMTPRMNNGSTQKFSLESPTVADYDGDGQLEVLMPMGWEVAVIGANGVQETASSAGASEPTYNTWYTVRGSPAVGDIDNDGNLEMVIAGGNYFEPNHGYLFAWRTGNATQNALPWPMFHHDARHTGRISPTSLVVSTSSLTILHPDGRPGYDSAALIIRNPGDNPIDWEAKVFPISTQPQLSVDPMNGVLNGSSSANLTVRVNNVALYDGQPGCYDVGYVQIEATLNGRHVPGSPARVSVQLCVGNTIWLSPIMK